MAGIEEVGYTYDLEKAKSLLAEAGYTANADGIMTKDDQVLKLDLFTSANLYQTCPDDPGTIQTRWCGIEYCPARVCSPVGNVIKGDYEIAIFNYGYGSGGILPIIFHSKMEGVMNPAHVNDPELDLLLDKVNTETDPAKQQEVLNQVQQIIMEKAYMLPLYNPTSYITLSKKVQNFIFSTKNNNLYLEDAYIQ